MNAETPAIWLKIASLRTLRAIMQWTHCSREPWRGQAGRTVIHWLLFLGHGAWSVVDALPAMGS